MTSVKAKLGILIISVVVVAFAAFSFRTGPAASGQTQSVIPGATLAAKTGPDRALVTRFDNAVQMRFLTEPYFGMARMTPVHPPSPHLSQFSPVNVEEQESVAEFEKEGWMVSLYLYGRRATPRVSKGKTPEKFDIRYRLNEPLPITGELKQTQLPGAAGLLDNVKRAFVSFQSADNPNVNGAEFRIGKWTYFARPVRAVNESCIRCHTDYVITAKLGDGQFTFRKRAVGDANGVIVYGFAKKDQP